jgi:hypothetical protein
MKMMRRIPLKRFLPFAPEEEVAVKTMPQDGTKSGIAGFSRLIIIPPD